jgi:chromosome segregation ATPase
MSLILRQLIGEQRGRRMASTTADPTLKKKLTETEKDLNSILKKWKFSNQNPKTSAEFIAKFEPWIDSQLKTQKELKAFLSKWGSTSLNQLETTWKDAEEHYQEQIKELKDMEMRQNRGDLPEGYEELETERDELKRDKTSLEQELLASNNQLKLSRAETKRKDQAVEALKKEASEKDKALNKQIKDWKEKYQKKAQLLDEEQLNGNQLEEKIEELNRKILTLETERKELLKNQKDL